MVLSSTRVLSDLIFTPSARSFSFTSPSGSLKKVTIGPGCTGVGGRAFQGCTSIKTVVLYAETPPVITSSTFSAVGPTPGGPADRKYYVPYSSDHSILNAYQTATNWSSFASQIYELNPDGTIQEVKPTLRGVGISNAFERIQIDRYSAISETGASIEFQDTVNTFKGWNTLLTDGGWIQYNDVKFDVEPQMVLVNACSEKGAVVRILVGKECVAKVKIPARGHFESTIQ